MCRHPRSCLGLFCLSGERNLQQHLYLYKSLEALKQIPPFYDGSLVTTRIIIRDKAHKTLGFAFKEPRVNPKKLETGLRTIRAVNPYTVLLRIEAIAFPTFGHLL